MAFTIEAMRQELHEHKEWFDDDVCGNPVLSQAQKLRLWEDFLSGVAPLAQRLAAAERQRDYWWAKPLDKVS